MKPITLAALALALVPAVARPCSPPPPTWTLKATAPADGAVDVPVDAPLVFVGQHGGYTALPDQVVVEATLDGEPVPLTRTALNLADFTAWRPDAGWRAGETYTVRHGIVDHIAESEPVFDHTFTFTAGDAMAPSPAWIGAEAESRIAPVTYRTCVDPPDDDYTGTCECNAHEETGRGWALWLRAIVDAPPGAVAMAGELRVAPTIDALADPRARVIQPFADRDAIDPSVDLGDVTQWPGESVCWQAVVIGVDRDEAAGPAQCVALVDIEGYAAFEAGDWPEARPSDDRAPEARDEAGCDASGGAPGGLGWLLVLVALGRSRRVESVHTTG